MRLLDRYIIRSFLFNYVLAFAVLVGMYTLLDLIINFDRFTKAATPDAGGLATFVALMADILDFYGYRMMVIFQQISAAIPLLAAGFTMVRMTRHNELTAMLASGVSLYRVALPIMLGAVFFSLLVIVDQEVLMPRCIDKLLRQHDEVSQVPTRDDPLFFVRSSDNSLLSASRYDPVKRQLIDLRILQRDKSGATIGRIIARQADWVTVSDSLTPEVTGYWYLKDALQIDDRSAPDPAGRVAERVGDLKYMTPLSPEQLDLVYSKKAVEYLSTSQIQTLIQNSPDVTKVTLEKIMHIRFTQPVMNLVLLLMGIPFLLTREPRQLIKNMIYCTALTSSCFVATFVLFQLAGTTVAGIYVPPLVGAWLPVLVFAPLSLMMLDTIRT
jgi:lipopolysaccharide export system permease protein